MTFKSKWLRKLTALGILYDSEWGCLYLSDPNDIPWVIIDNDGALDYGSNAGPYSTAVYDWTEEQLIETVKLRMQD